MTDWRATWGAAMGGTTGDIQEKRTQAARKLDTETLEHTSFSIAAQAGRKPSGPCWRNDDRTGGGHDL